MDIFVEGIEAPVNHFRLDNLLDTQKVITFDAALFPAGEYTIYATFGGHAYDSYMPYGTYIAPAESNKIKVTIQPNE